MKYLKSFEGYSSSEISTRLGRHAVSSSLSHDVLDSNKKITISYNITGRITSDNTKYFLVCKNTKNKPFPIKGIPPSPLTCIELIPTEEFTKVDLDTFSSLYSDKNHLFAISGWTTPGECHYSKYSIHITNLSKID